jgi:hypothetical protein
MANLIPEDWPGEDVNVEVWSMYDTPGQRFRGFWRIRVTHRATGAVSQTRGRYARSALAEALLIARRRARAYEAVGLADLAEQVREWWSEAA